MRKSIILLAVLVAASTQATAHPAENHAIADHDHTQKSKPRFTLGDPVPVSKFSFSPARCNDPSVTYEDWVSIYDGCMYAHRDDIARSGKGTSGFQARRIIDQKCMSTACEPSWWDRVKYK